MRILAPAHQQNQQEKPVPLLPASVVPDKQIESPAQAAPGINLTSQGRFRIELAPGFNPQALQTVLQILETAFQRTF